MCHVRWIRLLAITALGLTGHTAIARGQDPNALRNRMEFLQQQEAIILENRDWWIAKLRDRDMLLLPADPTRPWTSTRTMPRFVPRATAWETARHLTAAYTALHVPTPPTPDELMQDAEEQSRNMKGWFEQALLPAFERDLQAVREEFNPLMQQRTRQGETPRIAPAGRAWYFRRAVVGADAANPNFTLLDHEADESGGRVQVRGRVPSTNCFETWEMRWRFGANVSRLQQGMDIPISLEAQLVSAPCPSPLASFIAVGGGGMERTVSNSAPSPVFQGAIGEEGPRAAANGTERHAATSAVLHVTANPGQSNAWTAFRLQVYMPGMFWVVGYIYLAGGG